MSKKTSGMNGGEQQRKLIFFLGAGASLGAGAVATVQRGGTIDVPTQTTFWKTFLRFCSNSENAALIESFLFRFFLGYGRVPARLSSLERRDLLNEIDVEEVFTFLSERIRAPGTSVQLRTSAKSVWNALLAEIGPVFARFPANSATRSLYRRIVKQQMRIRDTIVSFNYDTVFEDSLAASQRWHYGEIETQTCSLRVLKPHGSSNWTDSKPIDIEEAPKRALVIAPTHLKFISGSDREQEQSDGYLDQSLQIQAVWGTMEREMIAARALVFIGYSFPSSDLYFSSVLRSAAVRSALRIVIVNPDALAIEHRLNSRFSIYRVSKHFDLQTFANLTRVQVLEDI